MDTLCALEDEASQWEEAIEPAFKKVQSYIGNVRIFGDEWRDKSTAEVMYERAAQKPYVVYQG